MKNILFLYLIALSFILLSCKKGSATEAETGSRLTGIRDSGMLVNFTYAADKITHANYSILGSGLNPAYADFEYSGDTDIKVSSPTSDVNIEFF